MSTWLPILSDIASQRAPPPSGLGHSTVWRRQAFWIATPPTRRSVRCIAICLPTTAPSRCPGRVRCRPRPGTEIHLAKALPADQRLRAYAQRIAHAHHHVSALSAKRSRPGDSARLEDKWKNWGFSDAEIKGARVLGPVYRGFHFRGSKRTSTSVLTLTGRPPLTGG